jgi:hypothetical protein
MNNLNTLVNYFLAEIEILAISLEKESSSRASLCKVCGSILMILWVSSKSRKSSSF